MMNTSIARAVAVAAHATMTTAPPPAAQTRLPPVTIRDDTPTISLRPFVLVAGQQASAKTTFKAAFGDPLEPFFGGGLQVALRNGFFVDASASRFKRTGEQSWLNVDNRQVFRLGIPMTATITPVEVVAGYRFKMRRSRVVVPYVGAGVGSYGYKQTSEFAAPEENVDTRHTGFLATGGVEFRVHRWVGVGVDAEYTHIPGILGLGGISQLAGEKDLGGISARFKLIVGR
jgi:opacity protein-like surface antigen